MRSFASRHHLLLDSSSEIAAIACLICLARFRQEITIETTMSGGEFAISLGIMRKDASESFRHSNRHRRRRRIKHRTEKSRDADNREIMRRHSRELISSKTR
ncbi:hypothetical protein TIFTF001_037290 [Ficus carica]|uniref:Uncharacterized protein n=1 Tax=Ficus carica TaxID=3494 RepID=A0AA88JDJ2_FICCA|nr:hypothetical protein TIFTF001_037271 [Ficus carica]GMN68217.1 hypothetical protein TIFTF001_037278 [Ficus carica]GMN68226.1 hypothetical protein TIFTF001_037283 [Ficus carica]GMN68229.1 hypothetical protein TIFTF001_037290 [Ficus carica]